MVGALHYIKERTIHKLRDHTFTILRALLLAEAPRLESGLFLRRFRDRLILLFVLVTPVFGLVWPNTRLWLCSAMEICNNHLNLTINSL